LRLAVLIRSGRFDLIHLHEYLNTRLFAACPTVMHFHNNPLADRDEAKFAADAPQYWALVGKSSAQIALSEFVVSRLRLAREQAGANALPANIFKVPGGVHPKELLPQNRKDARERTRRRLGLKDENASACLAIVGGSKLWVEEGWLRENMLEATEQQVLSILAPAIARNRAFMLGIVPPAEIGAYYAASDVFVLPSMFQETFGLVLLEAFSAGLPVIAFRSGGIPELVEDRTNGLVVEQGDEEALRQRMKELVLDRGLRDRLGSAAKGVPEKFPWENTVNRLEAIYRDVLIR
jgi:hypothetical protein